MPFIPQVIKSLYPDLFLSIIKRGQRNAFLNFSRNFQNKYGNLKRYDVGPYMMPLWNANIAELESIFLPAPPFLFLRNRVIRHAMFVEAGGNWLRQELTYLEEKSTRFELERLLQEDYTGGPPLIRSRYLTSHNSIHHLYSLFRFTESRQCRLPELNTVIEWGGGYGNLAKIFLRLNPEATYIIIDIPLFSCLQWLHLGTILSKNSVHLIESTGDAVLPGKINLLPLCFLNRFELAGDLFISTWALNESSRYSQDYVFDHNWFKARHLLLAYQDSDGMLPDSDRVGKMAQSAGAVIEDIDFLSEHHYAFR